MRFTQSIGRRLITISLANLLLAIISIACSPGSPGVATLSAAETDVNVVPVETRFIEFTEAADEISIDFDAIDENVSGDITDEIEFLPNEIDSSSESNEIVFDANLEDDEALVDEESVDEEAINEDEIVFDANLDDEAFVDEESIVEDEIVFDANLEDDDESVVEDADNDEIEFNSNLDETNETVSDSNIEEEMIEFDANLDENDVVQEDDAISIGDSEESAENEEAANEGRALFIPYVPYSENVEVEEADWASANDVDEIENIEGPGPVDVENETLSEPETEDAVDETDILEEPEVLETDVEPETPIGETSATPVVEGADVAEESADEVSEIEIAEESTEGSEEAIEPLALEDAQFDGESVEAVDASNIEEESASDQNETIVEQDKSTEVEDAYARIAETDSVSEFWIVEPVGNDFYCWKLENGSWRQTSSDEFFATDVSARTTVVWAHGYQTDMQSAVNSANAFRGAIENAQAATGVSHPYRLVVWKWASERYTPRIRIDARDKTAIADYNGVLLGQFLGRLNSQDDLALVGFSFGGRVVGSALQYLATRENSYVSGRSGFAVSGETAAQPDEKKDGSISLVLISAGCDYGAFDRGGCYSWGATLPEYVLNVYNPRDSALHFYPSVSPVHASALGVAPISATTFPNAIGRAYNMNINAAVGRKHSFTDEIKTIPYNTMMEALF